MKTSSRCLILMLSACALFLAGCQSKTSTTASATPLDTNTTTDSRLTDNHWFLKDARQPNGQPLEAFLDWKERRLQLSFTADRLGITGSCNGMGGSYTLEGQTLTIGTMIQTMMACEPTLMAREEAVKQFLREPLTLQLSDSNPPLMTLSNASGEQLHFEGIPTPEARYGSAADIIFLEVKANRVSCQHPLIPDYQCLHVRELVYTESGIKQSAGDWQYLYQEIEGYQHKPGIRNVLRLKRFKVNNPPADASSVAYVLDLVVESEQMIR